MTSYEDFHNHMKHNLCGIKFGFRICDQKLLGMFQRYKREGLIIFTVIDHHREHTFIKFDITEKGQSMLEFNKL